MLLKIGELAKRTGLTVRALHHYDAIGLLSPSARSDAGYRLYNEADIARLHRILALRRFGLALADIGTTLTRADLSLATVVARQIGLLTEQIQQAKALRSRLFQLQGQLADGQEPDLADWLTTLEHMTMYDKYFSQEELTQLPIYTQADDHRVDGRAVHPTPTEGSRRVDGFPVHAVMVDEEIIRHDHNTTNESVVGWTGPPSTR